MKRSMKRVYGAGCVLALAAALAPCGPAAYAAPAAAGGRAGRGRRGAARRGGACRPVVALYLEMTGREAVEAEGKEDEIPF